jgi:hypothetical protein
MRNAYKILVRKLQGKRPLERHKHSWEDNIKIDNSEVNLVGVDGIQLA